MSVEWGNAGTAASVGSVSAGEFFPALDGDKFRRLYRIPTEIPPEVVREQLALAVGQIRRQLKSWSDRQTAATLAETCSEFGDAVMLFERACFTLAKAELLRETATVDRRKEAENAAKSGETTEDKYREFSADAVAMLRGESSITVELL